MWRHCSESVMASAEVAKGLVSLPVQQDRNMHGNGQALAWTKERVQEKDGLNRRIFDSCDYFEPPECLMRRLW